MDKLTRGSMEGSAEGKGRVASLGMFIIDHFQTTDVDGESRISQEESVGLSPLAGGGGVFAMVCARMFLPPRHCGLIIDIGTDFPESFKNELASFGDEMIWFRPREGLTTRALNIYSGHSIGEGHQSFEYLSPQLRLHLRDLLLPPSPLIDPMPEWVHVVCSIPRARDIIEESRSIVLPNTGISWSGKLVWEPLPLSCVPDELLAFIELSRHFAVISPNILELQSLLSIKPSSSTSEEEVVHATHTFRSILCPNLDKGRDGPAIVVRAGRLGSFTLSEKWSGWVRPFFTPSKQDQRRVVDPTGGGNGFLGGLCAGLLLTDGDFRPASYFAATAASFAIEQKGLPRLSRSNTGNEIWNDDDPWERLREIIRRHEPEIDIGT